MQRMMATLAGPDRVRGVVGWCVTCSTRSPSGCRVALPSCRFKPNTSVDVNVWTNANSECKRTASCSLARRGPLWRPNPPLR
jgi:hypothetical protein